MLQGETIIILSLMRFDGLPSTNFTVAKYLAKHNDVYYIENPYTLSEYLRLNKNDEKFLKRKEAFRLSSDGILQYKEDNVNIVVPKPVFPSAFLPRGVFYKVIRKMNENIILLTIKRILREKNINDYIYINFYNYFFPDVGESLGAKLKIYYCVDPIPGYYKKHGITDEKKLINNSQVVICTSRKLYEQKKLINPNTYFIPNAADLVNSVKWDSIKSHPALETIEKPVIGYIGAIEGRIDYELLKDVIKKAGHLNFVFVGPVYKEYIPEWFFNCENVFLIDSVPYGEVSEMINGFDVCIIPFRQNSTNRTVFPLKLFEFLGLGKPTVVTDFNEDLREYTGEVVNYVKNTREFIDALYLCLEQRDNKSLKDERIKIAGNNTWQKRVNDLSDIIGRVLKHHKAGKLQVDQSLK